MAGNKVMVVDDDPDVNYHLKALLENAGFEVVCHFDGASALRHIREQKPDIVLLDVMMPGINGYEVCEKIKSDPDTASIPVIILTAKDMGEDLETAMKKKADWFIARPPDNKHLINRIEHLLEKK